MENPVVTVLLMSRSFGQMPFLMSPMTHLDPSRNQTQVQ